MLYRKVRYFPLREKGLVTPPRRLSSKEEADLVNAMHWIVECPECGEGGLLKYSKSRRYFYPYVSHYDKKLYSDQKKDYKPGQGKPKPKGTVRHYYRWDFQPDHRLKTNNARTFYAKQKKIKFIPKPKKEKKLREEG
jgi:hypothetical protein